MEKISEDFVSRTRQDAEKQNQAEQNASFGRQQRMNQEVPMWNSSSFICQDQVKF